VNSRAQLAPAAEEPFLAIQAFPWKIAE